MGQAIERIAVIGNMDLYFNELSIKEASTKETGKQWMAQLTNVYKAAYKKGFKELKTSEAFMTTTLAPGYKLIDWLYDPSVDEAARRIVMSKISKSPFIEELLTKKDDETHRIHEFKFKERNAAGLGAAYLYDSAAVSFANSIEWDTHLLELNITEYDEDDHVNGAVEKVRHASEPGHIEYLEKWLEAQKRTSIPNGKLLWLKRKTNFPDLVFCKNVEDQISFFSGAEPGFHAILKRLFELQSVCSTWTKGVFTGENFPSKVTPESESRLSKFKKELMIMCPDGESREFSWHLRYTPGAGRIHFVPDNSKKIIYIGYIGQKIQ
ncbi:MAG: hypothetical protein GY757_24440 [bacterium]|nr:hypothetical protein [bacterium]